MNEEAIHDKAVKIRKMTDEQLVNYIEDRVAKARSEGFNQGISHAPRHKTIGVDEIISDIGNVKGIGVTKLQDIKIILERHLEAVGNG